MIFNPLFLHVTDLEDFRIILIIQSALSSHTNNFIFY